MRKFRFKYPIIFVLIISMLSSNVYGLGEVSADKATEAATDTPQVVSENGNYLVKFKDADKGKKSLDKRTKKEKKHYKNISLTEVELTSEDLIALQQDDNVEYIEPDSAINKADEDFSLSEIQIDVPKAFEENVSGQGVKVAVFDTGVNTESSDLFVSGGASFVDNESTYDDLNGHGTAVASVLAALRNGQGLVGVAPNVELYAVKVMDQTGAGAYSQVIQGIDWAIDNHMDIINMSFTGTAYSQALKEAIDKAQQNGILVVAAAGNDQAFQAGYPAAYDTVISVGAVDSNNQIADFSNRGKVDLVAPGVNVDVLSLEDQWIPESGTSFAASEVTGVAALLKEKSPALTVDELRSQLQSTAKPLGDPTVYGHGLVNAYQAVMNIIDDANSTTPIDIPDDQTSDSDLPIMNLPETVTEFVPDNDEPLEEQLIKPAASYTLDANSQLGLQAMRFKTDQAPYSVQSALNEDISTMTGGLSISAGDLTLPGRNGLSFTLSRTYSTEDSIFYKENMEPFLYCVCNITFNYFKYQETKTDTTQPTKVAGSDSTGKVSYNSAAEPYSGGSLMNNVWSAQRFGSYLGSKVGQVYATTDWSGPDSKGVYTRNVVGVSSTPSFVYSQSSEVYLGFKSRLWGQPADEIQFPIGKGWSWNVPYIEYEKENGVSLRFLHLPGKGTYQIDGTKLSKYPWNDIAVSSNTSITVNGVQSTTAVKVTGGLTYYFSAGGKVIQIADNYQNAITFTYSTQGSYVDVLTSIQDPVGNTINIAYTPTQVTLTLGSKQVIYTKSSGTYTNPAEPYEQSTIETLSSVKDVQGNTTNYEYEIKDFKENLGTPGSNKYALLTAVQGPTGVVTHYEYENAPTTRNQQNSWREVYRLTKRYDHYTDALYSPTTRDVNVQTLSYNADMGSGEYNTSKTFSSTMSDGLSSTVFTYLRDYKALSTTTAFALTSVSATAGGLQQTQSYQYNDTLKPIPNTTTIQNTNTQTQEKSEAVVTTQVYDDYGHITSTTNALNVTTQQSYDASTHLLYRVTQPIDATQTLVTTYERDSYGGIADIYLRQNSYNGTLLKQYHYDRDIYGNIVSASVSDGVSTNTQTLTYGTAYKSAFPTKQTNSVIDANSASSTVAVSGTYDIQTGLLSSITDGNGNTTSYAYDLYGRLTSIQYPKLSDLGVTKASVAYSDTKNTITSTDEKGRKQEIDYDPLGRLQSTGYLTTVFNVVSKQDYDDYGRLAWSEDAKGNRTTYGYQLLPTGTKVTVTAPNLGVSSEEEDVIHRTKTSIDAEGNKSVQTFDKLGQLVSVTTTTNKNEVTTQSFQYNSIGLTIKETDPNQNETTYSYDALGRLTSVTQIPDKQTGAAEVTQYKYNPLDLVTAIIHPDQTQDTKFYDELGRLIKQAGPDGKTDKTFYDGNGNVIQTTDLKGQTFNYVYNARNWLMSKQSPNSTISYTYFADGDRKTMTDGTGTTSYQYDSYRNLLSNVTFPDTKSLTYTYDENGNRITMSGLFGLNVGYTYNNMNQLDTVKSSSATAAHYDYYKNGLAKMSTLGNGYTVEYVYNGANLTSLTQKKNGSSTTQGYSYTYDKNGNMQSLNETGDNVKSGTFTYDGLNRIQTSSLNSEVYSYDSRGNRTTLQSSATLGTASEVSYQYDDWNQLTQVTTADSKVVKYTYNGDGLLYERDDSGVKNRYYYDGTNVVAIGLVNSDGTVSVKAQYVRGNGLISTIDAQSQNYYYLTNGHGDVTELRDKSGGLVNQYTYDLWGSPNIVSEKVYNPFLYSGEMWDSTTQLQYLRARWYDPSEGRFINKDTYEGDITNPLTLNLYTYVENNPLIYLDPSGNHKVKWTTDVEGKRKYTILLDTPGFWDSLMLMYNYAASQPATPGEAIGQMAGEYVTQIFASKKAWSLSPTERGKLIEYFLATSYYADWDNVGALMGGYFPVIDFYDRDHTVISVKTMDTDSKAYANRDAMYLQLTYYVIALRDANIQVDGVEVANENRILDIWVKPGQADDIDIEYLKELADANGIIIQVEEF
ncbi:RHS repeat-associated protein [Paenibacillus cellulosilyticus]|uniref:RHS repeat-associated protein n=1 Tax=Paenibacillus cellulosilyticus TaxID=375489 RepID=A0A2V2YQA9_9BACL|nr:S8 family serine peptidase [Paenibacillus cellulosilyticus]PWV97892.1 RHS repeat-associated protein [Paenibacillus cellulosilyticus]QKS46937.1 S8 family serine peptidase [Paenibacillus cellulosilyticus]